MSTLKEAWLQEIAKRNNLPALRPTVIKTFLPVVELQLRKIIQQAHKFSRRGRTSSAKLTVEDINQALELNNLEPLYGLIDHRQFVSSAPTASSLGEIVSLVQLAKAALPKCPLAPELSLHWLAVEGVQPVIPENPSQQQAAAAASSSSSSSSAATDDPHSTSTLPRELQQFYHRVTGVLLAAEGGEGHNRTLRAVLTALREDAGLQDLVPYLSRFVYHNVKANTRSLPLLRTLMSAVHALLANPSLRVEFHLQQLLPAIFTAIVAPKLSSSPSEDHWALRAQAAAVIASACIKYSPLFPDLQARVCKTYLEALQPDRALSTLCGGLLGLGAMGQAVVRSLLLPQVRAIGERLRLVLQSGKRAEGKDRLARESVGAEMCLAALAHALGAHLAHSLRLGLVPAIRADGLPPGLRDVNEAQGPEDDAAPSKRRRGPMDSLAECSASHVAGLEEALVPYHASAAASAAHCRIIF